MLNKKHSTFQSKKNTSSCSLSTFKNSSSLLTSRKNSTNYLAQRKEIRQNKNQFLQKKQKTNSLEELTKKFTKYVIKLNANTIDLDNFIKKFKVKKRRIIDVTDILEGKN